jgi:transglutaminase-like putative cysteine protease
MRHKIKAFLFVVIFSLSYMTRIADAATYNVDSSEEEIMAFNRGMASNDSEFTLNYNPEEEDYIVNMLGYEYSLQDYTDADYAYYNVTKMTWSSTKRTTKSGKTYTVKYTLEEMETPEQTKFVYDTVHKLIKDNPKIIKASNYDKVAWAYDYIIDNFNYDYEYENYSAYEALKEHKAVCQGFVKLFYVMAIELGLNCKIVSGDKHAWNLVELEGKWYYVDTTWGACGWGRKYLLKAKKNMTDHTLDSVYEDYFDFATADYRNLGDSGYNGILASVYDVKFDTLKRNILAPGETFQWMLENPDKVDLTFQSDNTKVATVSAKGFIKGVKTGTTVIRAVNKKLGIEQICVISVNKVEPVVLRHNDISVKYNKTEAIRLEVSPSNASLKKLSYQSKDKSIASVDAKGKVTGVRAGSTVITVSYGSGQRTEIPVTVLPAVNSNYKTVTLSVNKTVSIENAVAVSANGYKDLNFKTTDLEIASVSSSGIVTGVSKGNCNINIYDKSTGKLVTTVKITVK